MQKVNYKSYVTSKVKFSRQIILTNATS